MPHFRRMLAVLGALCVATPVFAATTAKVTESGEGGGPMTLTLDQPTVKAGEVVFMVHNDAMTEEHEMVLVKLKKPDQRVSVVNSKHRVDENQLKSLGEVSDLKPGRTVRLRRDLYQVPTS